MFFSSILLLCVATVTLGLVQPNGVPFKFPVTVAPGIDASVVFSNLTNPRGITFDSQQNLLVVEHGVGVSAYTRVNSPVVGWNRTLVIASDAFTHGIQVEGTTLYVSTASDVLAYKYNPTTRTASAAPSTLIAGLPADGELLTHTLQLEDNGSGAVTAILVGSGPLTNIDITARNPASGRSQIRRFVLNTAVSLPLSWSTGEVIAFGIRNPGGFTFSPQISAGPINSKTLLVVENGASINGVTGITDAFANDNPGDEIETVSYLVGVSTSRVPPSYGFPDCTTLWNPKADPIGDPQYTNLTRGAQFSLNLPTTVAEVRDDAWCRNVTNNIPPSFAFQAHSVPLDIKLYQPKVNQVDTGVPATLAGDAFVSFHGSFDRSPPTGYGVVHVPVPFNTNADSVDRSFLIQAADLTPCPAKCLRPVGLAFGDDNRLYASSDSTGEIFVLHSSAVVS